MNKKMIIKYKILDIPYKLMTDLSIQIGEKELEQTGVNIVIYANQLIRSAIESIVATLIFWTMDEHLKQIKIWFQLKRFLIL